MNASKILKSVKEYFNLRSAATAVDADYNFSVEVGQPLKTLGEKIKDYFDLYHNYRSADKVAQEIMLLANAEGVTKGRCYSPAMTMKASYSYNEGDFSVKLKADGSVLLKCDAVFAEKVKSLPMVAGVKEINRINAAAPAPKTDTPQP